MKLKNIKWFHIARLVIRAVKLAIDEANDAKDPDSHKGAKISAQEALEISSSVLASLVEPLSDILTDELK